MLCHVYADCKNPFYFTFAHIYFDVSIREKHSTDKYFGTDQQIFTVYNILCTDFFETCLLHYFPKSLKVNKQEMGRVLPEMYDRRARRDTMGDNAKSSAV